MYFLIKFYQHFIISMPKLLICGKCFHVKTVFQGAWDLCKPNITHTHITKKISTLRDSFH